MNTNYSKNLKDIINYSHEEAERLGNNYIGPEHILLAILRSGEGNAHQLLASSQLDLMQIKHNIESSIKTNENVVDLDLPFLKSSHRILKLTSLEARNLNSAMEDSEHLLLAILRDKTNLATEILALEHVDYDSIIALIKENNSSEKLRPDIKEKIDAFMEQVKKEEQTSENDEENNDKEESEDEKSDISIIEINTAEDASDFMEKIAMQNKNKTKTKTKTKSLTPALDKFGTDLTKAAEMNMLDPVVGRDNEVERLAQILSRRKKNNPILIGDPGVGKSAIVEGLAKHIIANNSFDVLRNKRIISLDMASVVAGTKYRGQFEERLLSIIQELEKNKNIILFIDEIHTLIGAGATAGSMDAANMLKPALARGKIQCIGATTLNEYRQSIEKDGGLERRFQKIIVQATNREETLEILHNIKERYEEHHNVHYSDAALEACVKLTDRYINDRYFPDKAIDAMDEAGSRASIGNTAPKEIKEFEKQLQENNQLKLNAVKNEDFKLANEYKDKQTMIKSELDIARSRWMEERRSAATKIDEEDISEVISMISGVPVHRIAEAEFSKLRRMNETLKTQVVGQEDAILSVSKAILRNRVGMKDPNSPIGSFIFLGPTGVGKTHLAKSLADFLFDSKENIIRVDMSEYMEKFSVSRLIGAPPGYVGYEEGGQLTEKVRRNPYSIILFDEIEKAHPDVFNLLLQVLDDGMLTDNVGRVINFKNTIIIMTSNAGTRQLKDFGQGIGYATAARQGDKKFSHGILKKSLQKTFSPEFLNRVDDIVIFNQLSKESCNQIIDIELVSIIKRIEALGFLFEMSQAAKDFIASEGYDVEYGARPLKRTLQKHIEDEVADILVNKTAIKEGSTLYFDYNEKDKEITCTSQST